VNGIVVVDKPAGPTSFDVVAQLRRIFKTREIGHCGTLDPLATGVLVVAVGSYTRLVRVLTADDKRYRATIAFGTSTSTDDREGDVVAPTTTTWPRCHRSASSRRSSRLSAPSRRCRPRSRPSTSTASAPTNERARASS
jgi:tRNA pseudouridine(55) synthase